MGINRVVLMGRLTRDPELRHTPTGTPVVSFTIAVDRAMSKNNATDFINCFAWRTRAEFISRWFSKGSMIAVEGELQSRTYKPNGSDTNRSVLEVNISNVSFTGERKDSTGGEYPPQADFSEIEEDDGDLPF